MRDEWLQKYNWQKQKAKKRGIAWEIEFSDWIDVWRSSGKMALRGRGAGKYVMARHGDVGPYSKANVAIKEWSANLGEAEGKRLAAIASSTKYAKRGKAFGLREGA